MNPWATERAAYMDGLFSARELAMRVACVEITDVPEAVTNAANGYLADATSLGDFIAAVEAA